MKSLLKVVALLVIAMPLWAAEVTSVSTSTSSSNTASMTDCSAMMGMERSNCMSANITSCNSLTGDAKVTCMRNADRMNATVTNGGMDTNGATIMTPKTTTINSGTTTTTTVAPKQY